MAPRRRPTRRWRGVVMTAVLVAVLCGAGNARASGAGTVPPQWPANPSWQRYVPAPKSSEVRPTALVASAGDVVNAKGLFGTSGRGRTTLSYQAGSTPPSVTVDYGEDVAGIPYFEVSSADGAPTLQATYSEGLQYLGPSGDDTPSSSGAGDSSRVDELVATPGILTTDLIQGGQRYERISLASPGSVTLSGVGIEFTSVRATPSEYRGWFDSSAPELDRIWYDGAYTTQLDEIPAKSVPTAWSIVHGSLRIVEGVVGLLARGTGWSDYTVAFDTRVLGESTSWMVRARSPSSGYLFILQLPSGTRGSGPTLTEVARGPTEFSVIGRVTLPAAMALQDWHHITTRVDGSRITTSIDGRSVATFDTATLSPGTSVYDTGTIGLASFGSAMFRGLRVTASGGTVLYANALSHSSALADFPGPDVTTPDPLPVVVDGAKRDRVVWSGDLGTESPTIFYSTDNPAFLRGSLGLLGSYQRADGETGTNVDPTAGLGTFPESGASYSASYSMDEVLDIATYYLYSGDLSFVRTQWPMIMRELAYDRSLVDQRGLLVTDADNGQDWDYYDGSRVGEVTAYNVIYDETLTAASTLADALGQPNVASQLRTAAAALRTAINRYLFDPASSLYPLSNSEPAIAQDANALAVVSGVAAPSIDGRLLTALQATLPATPYGPEAFTANAGYRTQVSPFATNDEVQALFAANRTAAALSLIETVWGHMDAPGPDDTRADWELVSADGSPGFGPMTSLSHGWSTGATADLSSYVLGVRPTAAGFREWQVQPHLGDLSWVEGDVPTPHGAIAVRWAHDIPTQSLAMQVQAPSGTAGVISVPVPPAGATITVRASHGGSSTTTRLEPAAGVAFQSVTARGGTTYLIDVLPR